MIKPAQTTNSYIPDLPRAIVRPFTILLACGCLLGVGATWAHSSEPDTSEASNPEALSSEASETTSDSIEEAAASGTLSGTWKLNRKESDDPREKMQSQRSGRRSSGGGFGGGGGGGGGFGGGGRGGGSFGGQGGGPPGGGRGAQEGSSSEGPSKLEIVHGDAEVIVVDGSGREQYFFIDGREKTVEGFHGEATQSAEWNGDALIVTTTGPMGEATETYRRTTDDQLEITVVRPETERRPEFELKRVYDLKKRKKREAS